MRPSANLSGTWNISAGGGLPMAGRSHSEEAKQKVSVANRGRIPSKETREKMRKSQLGRKHSEETKSKIGVGNRTPHTDEAKAKMSASWNKGRDWNHPRANEKVWVKAIEMSAYILQHPEHGCERMMQNFNLPKSTSPTIYKKIKSGWNPSLDPSYLSWLQEYKVKEANNYAKT